MPLGLDNKVLMMKDLTATCSLDRGSVSMLAAFRIQIDLTARAIVHRRTGVTQLLVLWLAGLESLTPSRSSVSLLMAFRIQTDLTAR